LKYLIRKKKTVWFSHSAGDSFLLFIVGIMLFILFSGGLAAIFRSNVGYGEGLAQRYRFFGQLFVLAFYFLFIYYHNFSKNSLIIGLIVSLTYCFFAYVVYLPDAKNYMVKYTSSEQNILDHGETYIYGGYGAGLEKEIDNVLVPSILEANTYHFTGTKFLLNKEIASAKEIFLDFNIIDSNIILDLERYKWSRLSEKKFLLIKQEGKSIYLPLNSVNYFSKYYNYADKLMAPLYPKVFDGINDSLYLITVFKGKVDVVKIIGINLRE
jgi:hypothetical protein